MRGKWLALAFAWASLAASSGGGALQTAWEIKGHLTSLDPGSSFPADFTVGAPFRILASFDTTGEAYSATSTAGGGYRYLYTADTLAYQVFIGSTCTPCNPVNDPTQSGIIVRDNAPDPATAQLVDGYTFFLGTADGTIVNLIMRGPVLDIVNGPGLAAVPDPRLAGLATSLMQICYSGGYYCVNGAIESVASPALGTTYFLSTRDCYTIDTTSTSADTAPRDCIYVNSLGQTRLGRGRFIDAGGGLGSGEFGKTVVFDGSFDPAILSPLGSVYGAITFNGPAGLPVLKASSTPTDVSRTNSNLLAYQRYAYTGPATSMPLVVDLGYGIADHSTDTTASSEIGLRPGGAQIAATLAIVDGGIPMPALAGNINTLTCGAEPTLLLPDGVTPWPAGSILGSAQFNSPGGQVDPGAATTLNVRSCADASQAVQLAANQGFIVATSVQTPARGKWSSGTPAVANGYVDASHTMRVTFDPNAPPALVQQLADSITPACSDCSPPEVTTVGVDVRPGSTGCINPTSNGVIPVAILGSATFKVKDLRRDDSLRLGSLALRVRGSKPLCSVTQVNADGYDDLVCQFDNVSTSWASGQTTATVSGKLYNGLPIQGSDTICVK
ncbi:MAG TPA: hypothetical protein VGV08_08235 [Casimicrobiaceae bacterium]|nr:hypothetical protein [Casimicrobiaceae bacterium]